jgi:hypothetical protein
VLERLEQYGALRRTGSATHRALARRRHRWDDQSGALVGISGISTAFPPFSPSLPPPIRAHLALTDARLWSEPRPCGRAGARQQGRTRPGPADHPLAAWPPNRNQSSLSVTSTQVLDQAGVAIRCARHKRARGRVRIGAHASCGCPRRRLGQHSTGGARRVVCIVCRALRCSFPWISPTYRSVLPPSLRTRSGDPDPHGEVLSACILSRASCDSRGGGPRMPVEILCLN